MFMKYLCVWLPFVLASGCFLVQTVAARQIENDQMYGYLDPAGIESDPLRQLVPRYLPNTVLGKEYIETVTGMSFVWVPGGCFMMGTLPSDSSTVLADRGRPRHKVCVDGFFMGKYEVTQEEYKTIMGKNPSRFWGKRHPVEHVSWYDTQRFISQLSRRSGKNFRLPTEAEWEYAARAGTSGFRYWGNRIGCHHALFENGVLLNENGCSSYYGGSRGTVAVGSYAPNQFGLYDMLGNVWEWCSDWYSAHYYANSPLRNPWGPDTELWGRVKRGGGWEDSAKYIKTSVRFWDRADDTNDDIGFRLVLLNGK